jgi:hypothetical protein
VTTLRLSLGCCLIALLLVGCRNTPPTMPPTSDPWQAANTPTLTLGSSLSSIAFAGDRGVALGQAAGKAGNNYMLLSRGASGAWTHISLADPPSASVLLDAALTAEGVVIGGLLRQGADTCLVYDERGFAPARIVRPGFGIAAVDGDDALMVAGGSGIGGVLWTSRTPQFWEVAATPLDPTHEGGFTDVFVGNGEALACGFDDGAATPQIVLRLQASDNTWHLLPLGAGAADKTLRCIAAGDDGTMMLGGIAGAGGAAPRAFAWLRGVDGIWRALTLPDGDMIGGVNDVLPVPGGVWYLACGGEGGSELATILRLEGGTIKRDLKPFIGTIEQLARAADGTICAVGWSVTEGTGLRQPLLLER